MSVTTEADKARDAALAHIVEAIRELAKIEDEVWGWDGFDPTYAKKLDDALQALRRIRRDLR